MSLIKKFWKRQHVKDSFYHMIVNQETNKTNLHYYYAILLLYNT